jgi:hypothetical protein
MEEENIKKYREKMIALYQCADALCQKFPQADRHVLIQSWLMRDKSPLEKIQFALLRGKVFKRKYAQ